MASFSKGFHNISIYMNIINVPFGDLTNLNYFGLYNGRNIQYKTDDGILINGWHILPPGEISWNLAKIRNKALKEKYFNEQLRNADTIVIQLHGNAANRGVPRRIELMKQLSSELSAHVIAIDYRGFGDSTGWPSENGTTSDLFGLWKWLDNIILADSNNNNSINNNEIITNKNKPKIIIYGLSLGTGIAVEFLYHLTKLQQQQQQEQFQSSLYPSGLILNSPFSSIGDAIHDYPYAAPLRIFPFFFRLMSSFLSIHYSTVDHIHIINCPILILHGTDDRTIPIHHSRKILKSYELHSSHSVCDLSQNNLDHNSICNSSINITDESNLHLLNKCSLRIKAIENGDAFSGMECISTQNNSNNTLPIISLVEIQSGTHENVFRLNDWLATVPDFVRKCK